VPDLRGMGLSSHPAGGLRQVDAGRRYPRRPRQSSASTAPTIVGHDIGTMVAYAYAARYPDKTSRLVVMDSPVPGIPPWNQIVRLPRCGTSTSAARTPSAWSPAASASTSTLLERVRWRPLEDRRSDPPPLRRDLRQAGAMHSAFAQFLAIGQKDEADNVKAMETKLAMPVLAIGAAKAFGANVAVGMRNAATNGAGTRRAERRPLADGGSARGDDHRGAGLPRSALSPAAARSLRHGPSSGGSGRLPMMVPAPHYRFRSPCRSEPATGWILSPAPLAPGQARNRFRERNRDAQFYRDDGASPQRSVPVPPRSPG